MSAQNFSVPPPRHWTREEYYRAYSVGLFGPEEKLELIRGEIYKKMPQGTPHTIATERTERRFLALEFAGLGTVRSQKPITLLGDSEPEPDVAFARGSLDDYQNHHPGPSDLLLVVEVSDTTLAYDRTDKARLYAEAGIAEYWVLSVNERLLEVRRDPQGGEYRNLQTVREGGMISPLFAPTENLAVADMLPRE